MIYISINERAPSNCLAHQHYTHMHVHTRTCAHTYSYFSYQFSTAIFIHYLLFIITVRFGKSEANLGSQENQGVARLLWGKNPFFFFFPFPASSSSPYFLGLAPIAIFKASNCSLRPLCAPLWSLLKCLVIPQALLEQPGVLSPFSDQLHQTLSFTITNTSSSLHMKK